MTTPQGNARRRWWPHDPSLFASTAHCPACFSPLTSMTCARCGLSLDSPLAADVLDAGRRLLHVEEERQGIIARIREEQAARYSAHIAHVADPAPSGQSPLTAQPTTAGTAPRATRSGVQVLLLTLGVILVSVAAVFFLLVAYLFSSLALRAAMTGIVSVLVLGLAWLLAWRRLRGTAEGIAVLGIALALIVVWIVGANGLFGTAALAGTVFTGASFVVIALMLTGFSRLSRIRAAVIAACALAPLGAALWASGLLRDADAGAALWAGAIAAGLTGLLAVWVRDPAGNAVLKSIAFTGLGVATVTASFACPETEWAPPVTLAVTAAAWLLHIAVERPTQERFRQQGLTPWQAVAAVGAGTALALAPTVATVRAFDASIAIWAAPTAAGVMSVLVLVVFAAAANTVVRRITLSAFFAAAGLTALAAVPAFAFNTLLYLAAVAQGAIPWQGQLVWGTVSPLTTVRWAPLAGVCLAVLAAVGAALTRRSRMLSAIPVGLGAGAALAAGGAVEALEWSLATFGALATACLLGLLARKWVRVAARIVLATTGALALIALFAGAHVRPEPWPYAIAAVLVILVAARLIVHRIASHASAPWLGAVLTGGAAASILSAAWSVYPWWQAFNARSHAFSVSDQAFWPTAIAASALVACPLLLARALRRADVAALAAVSGFAVIVGTPLLAVSPALVPEQLVRTLVLGLLAAAGVLWQRVPRTGGRIERYSFAVASPFVFALLGWSLADDVFDAPRFVVLASVLALVLAAALTLVLFRGAHRIALGLWEAATAAASTVVFVWLLAGNGPLAWLALLVLALVPLLIASAHGDVFTSRDGRRHVAWVALPLAAGGLWMLLGERGVDVVEAYSLPVAGALAALAAVTAWRRGARADHVGGSRPVGRITLVAAALGLGLIPSTLLSGTGDGVRAAVVIGAGLALTLAGLFVSHTVRGIPLRLLLAVSGASVALLAGVIRGVTSVLQPGTTGIEVEGWIAGGLAAVTLIAAMWTRRGDAPVWLAEWALVFAFAAFAFVESTAITQDEHAALRALVVGCVLAAAHIASVVVVAPPFGRLVEQRALLLAAIVSVIALGSQNVEPFEIATVPLALGLIVAGLVRLDYRETARTWVQLGPGLAVLLVPTLVADYFSPPLWRVVALGIAAITVVLLGVARKWQAPLVLGSAVLIAHAIAQLWPWIVDLYRATEWWLWLGIGGVILIVIAATYEKRVQNLKTVARSISSLR